jgi:hypothetical protein
MAATLTTPMAMFLVEEEGVAGAFSSASILARFAAASGDNVADGVAGCAARSIIARTSSDE